MAVAGETLTGFYYVGYAEGEEKKGEATRRKASQTSLCVDRALLQG